MANAMMMFDTLGVPNDDPRVVTGWAALRKLLVDDGDSAYCQPCLSPVWDTGLAGHAMAEADSPASAAVMAAGQWLRGKQILDVIGDWKVARPDAPPGGWAFQYNNDFYPDVDDTAVVGMLLHREMQATGEPANAEAIARARDWIIGMQATDGGWGAFDAVNGTQVFVTSGHSLSTLYFSLTTPNPITIGSSNITFALIPAPSSGAQTPYIVDSIAVLKSILTPAAALTYIVRGFAAVGDGGGGFYWWNAADVTADNGGTVIQLNIGGAGRFNKLF